MLYWASLAESWRSLGRKRVRINPSKLMQTWGDIALLGMLVLCPGQSPPAAPVVLGGSPTPPGISNPPHSGALEAGAAPTPCPWGCSFSPATPGSSGSTGWEPAAHPRHLGAAWRGPTGGRAPGRGGRGAHPANGHPRPAPRGGSSGRRGRAEPCRAGPPPAEAGTPSGPAESGGSAPRAGGARGAPGRCRGPAMGGAQSQKPREGGAAGRR